MKFYDAFESFRKQQQYLNNIINPPAMQALRNHQNLINQATMPHLNTLGQLDSGIIKNYSTVSKFTQDFNRWKNRSSLAEVVNNSALSKISREIRSWNDRSPLIESINRLNKLQIDFAAKYPETSRIMFNDITAATNSLNMARLFDDITFDSLSVFNEILDDIEGDTEPDYQEGNSDLQATLTVNRPDLVGNMTRDEFRVEIAQAFQAAQSGVSKDMDPKDRIRSFFAFFVEVFKDLGKDYAKEYVKKILEDVLPKLLFFMIAIASGNHDFEVGKQASGIINENDQTRIVKKTFVKNPEIEQPMGEMAFLRTESKLRTRPSNKSHLASKEPVSKNTVVFPIEKNGNWILVEVETKDDFYIGWVEESKVIKFHLEGKSPNK